MDSQLRLERAIGVPDAIVASKNRVLVAGRLLAQKVDLSFDTAEKRESAGSARIDKLRDAFSAGAVDLIGPMYASGSLDLPIAGDSEFGFLTSLAANGSEALQATVHAATNFKWSNVDDLQAMISAAVEALRDWSALHPVDPV